MKGVQNDVGPDLVDGEVRDAAFYRGEFQQKRGEFSIPIGNGMNVFESDRHHHPPRCGELGEFDIADVLDFAFHVGHTQSSIIDTHNASIAFLSTWRGNFDVFASTSSSAS